MDIVEKLSTAIVESLEKNDVRLYEHCRGELIMRVVDQDFFSLEYIKSYFIVGKALFLILDDMYNSPPLLYKRVVLCAVYCLLKTIVNDKSDKEECSVHASVMLFVLFSENKNFIGGEYLVSKLRNDTEAAAYQFVGMQNVFYWKYKLSNKNIQISQRTKQRVTSVISLPIKIPDESSRQKVMDFEYKNFSSLLEIIPIDIEMKYRGIFVDPLDTESHARLINSAFKPSTFNFLKKEDLKAEDAETSDANTSTLSREKNVKKGCMGLITSVLILIVVILIFN